MNSGVYGQVWGALVPRNEGVPLADYDFKAVQTMHCMCQQYRLPGSKGYLVLTGYIPSVVEWLVAYTAKFVVPWFPERKASLWQIMILWQSRRCTVCTSNVGSLGKGLYGTHRLHTLCCGMNSGVYGQVWGALVPRNEGVPLADYDFMAVQTLHCSYQQYRLPGSKG